MKFHFSGISLYLFFCLFVLLVYFECVTLNSSIEKEILNEQVVFIY